MTNSRADSSIPKEGDVAYFVKLHLDTLQMTGTHPSRPDHWLYSLEGKSRPMLVIRLLPERVRGRRWFRVLPITSKGSDGNGKQKNGVEPIGNCLDPAVLSFVELEPQVLPENMICRKSDGQLDRVTPCDPSSFANAVKVLMVRMYKSMRTKD